MLKRLKNSSGLSFIELLFTIAILGIVMISISSLLINTSKINRESELLYQATLLAQSYMEDIKSSDSVNVGQNIESYEDTKIIVDIVKIDKYKYGFYKITIKVFKDEELLESLEGYKITTQ